MSLTSVQKRGLETKSELLVFVLEQVGRKGGHPNFGCQVRPVVPVVVYGVLVFAVGPQSERERERGGDPQYRAVRIVSISGVYTENVGGSFRGWGTLKARRTWTVLAATWPRRTTVSRICGPARGRHKLSSCECWRGPYSSVSWSACLLSRSRLEGVLHSLPSLSDSNKLSPRGSRSSCIEWPALTHSPAAYHICHAIQYTWL